jgi:glutamate carboxypeptidase
MFLNQFVTLPAVLGISACLLAGQSLTPEEKKIVASVTANQANAKTELEQLVDINSGTLNPDGVRKVRDYLKPKFEELGFSCRWIPMDEIQRAGHMQCTHPGSHGKRVLLIGHMDTVFEPSSPFQKFEEKDGKTLGPGAADMKGGLVIMLSALKALKENGAMDGANITVFLTGDEERPGEPLSIARRDLIAAGKQSDAALEFEGGVKNGGKDAASISRRSSYQWILTTTGKTAHSSGIFNKNVGDGAVYEMSRILYRFEQELHDTGLTYNVGLMVGGTQASYDPQKATGEAVGKVNVVPAKAVAVGDMRTLTDEQYKRTQDKMQQIIKDHLPGTSAEIEFKDGYPSMPETAGNKDLLKRLNDVNQKLGMDFMEPLDPSRRGAGDLSFVAPYVASISGLGAYGGGAHAPGETINMERQPQQSQRVALYLYELTR